MTRPTTQIGDTVREMTQNEFEQWQIDVENAVLLQQAEQQLIVARTSARAKLAALGLTDTEIAALLGA